LPFGRSSKAHAISNREEDTNDGDQLIYFAQLEGEIALANVFSSFYFFYCECFECDGLRKMDASVGTPEKMFTPMHPTHFEELRALSA
jgi:hypothetical protein